MLRRYLEIQRVRFPDRLRFEIDVPRRGARGRRAGAAAAAAGRERHPPRDRPQRRARGASTSGPPARGAALHRGRSTAGRLADSATTPASGLSNTGARLEQLYGDASGSSSGPPRAACMARSRSLERGSRRAVSEPLRVLIVDDEPLARRLRPRAAGSRPGGRGGGRVQRRGRRREVARPKPDSCSSTSRCRRSTGSTSSSSSARRRAGRRLRDGLRRVRPRAPSRCTPLDYLLKPFDDARFAQALRRAKEQARARRARRAGRAPEALLQDASSRRRALSWFVTSGARRDCGVGRREIDWIEAADYYVSLHVGRRLAPAAGDDERAGGAARPERFFRVHRSAIVNLDRVREIHPLFRGDALGSPAAIG